MRGCWGRWCWGFGRGGGGWWGWWLGGWWGIGYLKMLYDNLVLWFGLGFVFITTSLKCLLTSFFQSFHL